MDNPIEGTGMPSESVFLFKVSARFLYECPLRIGLDAPGVDEPMRGWPGHAGDLGNGTLGDAELQEATNLMLLAVEVKLEHEPR